MADLVIQPSQGIKGEISLPGDKSISHRSVLFAAIAEGDTTINGFLTGEDTLNTAKAVQALGITVDGIGSSRLVVRGKGLDGLQRTFERARSGQLGNGHAAACRTACGTGFFFRPDRRPVSEKTAHGQDRGAAAADGRSRSTAGRAASGRRSRSGAAAAERRPIDFTSPVASAQVKSALLLAGLYADGVTSVTEPSKSRDHTERMFRFFGVEVKEEGTRVIGQGEAGRCGRRAPLRSRRTSPPRRSSWSPRASSPDRTS